MEKTPAIPGLGHGYPGECPDCGFTRAERCVELGRHVFCAGCRLQGSLCPMHGEKDPPEDGLVDGQCQQCGQVETCEPECRRALTFWARQDRDHKIAELATRYLPKLRALHDEWRGEVDRVYAEYDARVVELKAAA